MWQLSVGPQVNSSIGYIIFKKVRVIFQELWWIWWKSLYWATAEKRLLSLKTNLWFSEVSMLSPKTKKLILVYLFYAILHKNKPTPINYVVDIKKSVYHRIFWVYCPVYYIETVIWYVSKCWIFEYFSNIEINFYFPPISKKSPKNPERTVNTASFFSCQDGRKVKIAFDI